MDRRRAIKTTIAGASLAVCGCLSSGTSEPENSTQTEETNQTDSRTTGSNGPEDDSSTRQETGNITISVVADEDTAENFTQLELGIGRITLSSEAESSDHRILDTIDISGEPIKAVESEQIAPGEYNQVSLTATINRRELQSGESPYISKGNLSTALTDLRITTDSESKLTLFFNVSKDGNGDYKLTVQRAKTDN